MDWLNYHHLYYFWTVARAGSIAAASQELLLAPPTISAQIHELERSLGEKLFDRVGRSLALTEMGRVVLRYGDEIFSLGREMVDTLKGRSVGVSIQVNVGINDAIPKLVAYRLLSPVIHLPEPSRISCVDGSPAQLLPALAVHDLDLILSDAPVGPHIRVRAYSHLLGECGVTLFASPKDSQRMRKGFPRSLHGAPALLPAPGGALRAAIDRWLEAVDVTPKVIGEFEDIALLSTFGEHGEGFFAGYDVVESDIMRRFRVEPIGAIESHRERFFAITVERRIRHPAVAAIMKAARSQLFK
ncbi:MAG TPA: transcriptional activator NhaR [Phycisphaerae bacterium]|nr:transcriptional activator NhaR [Phycisphaerae bacterium]HRY68917.1 transcriptional activator NhaR [Phycisphaerae bacterium]HSA25744.1 transcriptional activator NhaR [Phycisphaerae bacterium]